MDGNYLKNKEEIVLKLKTWINQVIDKKLWDKYIDLHIDEIDSSFNVKENWFNQSLILFEWISEIIDISSYDLILAIPLSYSDEETNVNLINIDFLKNEMDITPPSFYLFPIGEKNYLDTINSSILLKKNSIQINYKVYYKEIKDDSEYNRIVYLTKDERI